MNIAFTVIAVEQHAGEKALVKAERADGSYVQLWLEQSEIEALGFKRVPVEQVKAGDRVIDIPIENGGKWKWAASKNADGSLNAPQVSLVVDVHAERE